jgi:hypothetical protein
VLARAALDHDLDADLLEPAHDFGHERDPRLALP